MSIIIHFVIFPIDDLTNKATKVIILVVDLLDCQYFRFRWFLCPVFRDNASEYSNNHKINDFNEAYDRSTKTETKWTTNIR